MDWPTHAGKHPNETLPFGVRSHIHLEDYAENIDFADEIHGGPMDRGLSGSGNQGA